MPDVVALEGCRVLELSHAAAAVAGRVLADLGAEVVKIEPPGGEPARKAEPALDLPTGERLSYFWLAFNAGKRSIAVDLADAEGRERFAELAKTADIVLTDFQRLDVAENDALCTIARAANPNLVWTEIWPYGRGEPHQAYPAGDLVLQAAGGHLYLNGDADRAPVRVGAPVAICQGGAEAASAALMAYYHRLRGGGGQRVDVSIQECVTWTLLNTTMTVQLLGTEEMRGGAVKKERANKFFTRLVWETRDGYIHFAPVGGGGGAAREKSYAALVAWMSEEGCADPLLTARDWNGSDQFSIAQGDYDAVAELIARFIAAKSSEELMERAVRDRILLAPVSSIPDLLESPQFRARGLFSRVADGRRRTDLEYPTRWVNMSETPLRPPGPPPFLDAQSGAAADPLVREVA